MFIKLYKTWVRLHLGVWQYVMVLISEKVISGSGVRSEEGNHTLKGMRWYKFCRKFELPSLNGFERRRAERRPDSIETYQICDNLEVIPMKNLLSLTKFDKTRKAERDLHQHGKLN